MKAKERRQLNKLPKKYQQSFKKSLTPKGYIKYEVRLVCGCCFKYLYFKSDENASNAIREVSFQVNATVTDESGQTLEGIDTFYGIWRA